MIEGEVIWASKLDGKYDCKVVRVDNYRGELTVALGTAPPVLSTPVNLSYGAQFGPDVLDVAEWERKCIDCIELMENPAPIDP